MRTGSVTVENADFDVPPLIWLISRQGARWSFHAVYIEKTKRKAYYVRMHEPSDIAYRS